MTMNDRINRTFVRQGFRGEMMVLWALSDLLEKNPDLPRPSVEFKQNSERSSITWYLQPDYGVKAPYRTNDEGFTDWDAYDRETKERRRVDLEERIAALVLALGEDVEWEKNDPTTESTFYNLKTVWNGMTLSIFTWRDAVCEEVVVLETEREEEQPDPEVVEKLMADVPKVKVTVTDKITEWQCNERIAAVTAPKHVRTVKVSA